jgi:hypothetical protein
MHFKAIGAKVNLFPRTLALACSLPFPLILPELMKLSLTLGAVFAVLPLLTASVSGQSLSTNDDGSVGVVLNNGGTTVAAAGSLTTLFASNNAFAGNMFDITPTADLEITGVDINVTASGTLAEVDIWYRVGTSVGFESSSAGWTLLGSYSGTSAGRDNPTFVDMAGNGMTFVGGQSYGMYIDLTSYSTQSFRYTNGANTYSNADLSLTTNVGKGMGFSGSTFSPREWNGTIYYEGGGLTLAVDQMVSNAVSTVTTAGSNAGAVVIVAYSFAGGGPTNTVVGMVDLSNPIWQLPPVLADVNGDTSEMYNLPAGAAGRSIWLQAVSFPTVGTPVLSNGISGTIL